VPLLQNPKELRSAQLLRNFFLRRNDEKQGTL
jgi:hypothetical protein